MAINSVLRDTFDTHTVYTVHFHGDNITATVTHESSVVTDWIEEILRIHSQRLSNLVVGLDVEWRPSFSRGHTNPVAILQLCVGHRCLIFQLIYASEIPQSLINFLANDVYKFVGVGIKQDLEKLEDDYGLKVRNGEDLGRLAVDCLGENRFRNAGLKGLGIEILGKEVSKPKSVTMSRWDQEWLTRSQVQYACVDAFLSFEIGRYLMSK